MIKEIREQPKAVEDTLHSIIKDGKIDIGLSDGGIRSFIKSISLHVTLPGMLVRRLNM